MQATNRRVRGRSGVGRRLACACTLVCAAVIGPSGCGDSASPKDSGVDADGHTQRKDGLGGSADGTIRPCTKSGPEVCDGVDNDCNGKVDEGYTLLCQPCTGAAASCLEARLAGGGFWVGTARNLVIGDDKGIALPPLPTSQPYIYIANSNEDTVSKVRTSDSVEVGRFLVGGNPSRTAVDGRGDAWVAMRGDTSDDGSGPLENVIKIDGACTPKTKPPAPTRECILLDVPSVGNLLRGLAVDARNDVWVGAYADSQVILLDGVTGKTKTIVGLPGHPYGLAMDPDGYVWVSAHDTSYASGFVYRVDPALEQVDIKLGATELQNIGTYGLAADGEGGIWYGTNGAYVFRVDAATGAVGPIHDVGYTTRGVAVDDKGFLWAADSGHNALLKIDRTTGATTTITVGNGPVGVAVDHEGNVWSVNYSEDTATKVSPAGSVLKTVTVGSAPYSYSDMTGTAYRIFKTIKGVFTGEYAVGIPGAKWKKLAWAGSVPSPATLAIRVRCSDSDPTKAPWQAVVLSGQSALLSCVGDQLQIEVTLATNDRKAMPNVANLTFEVER